MASRGPPRPDFASASFDYGGRGFGSPSGTPQTAPMSAPPKYTRKAAQPTQSSLDDVDLTMMTDEQRQEYMQLQAKYELLSERLASLEAVEEAAARADAAGEAGQATGAEAGLFLGAGDGQPPNMAATEQLLSMLSGAGGEQELLNMLSGAGGEEELLNLLSGVGGEEQLMAMLGGANGSAGRQSTDARAGQMVSMLGDGQSHGNGGQRAHSGRQSGGGGKGAQGGVEQRMAPMAGGGQSAGQGDLEQLMGMMAGASGGDVGAQQMMAMLGEGGANGAQLLAMLEGAGLGGELSELQNLGAAEVQQLEEMRALESQLAALHQYRDELENIQNVLLKVSADDPAALEIMRDQYDHVASRRAELFGTAETEDPVPRKAPASDHLPPSAAEFLAGPADGLTEKLKGMRIGELQNLRSQYMTSLGGLKDTLAVQQEEEDERLRRKEEQDRQVAREVRQALSAQASPTRGPSTQGPSPLASSAERRGAQRLQDERSTSSAPVAPAYLYSVLDDLEKRVKRFQTDSLRRIENAPTVLEKQQVAAEVQQEWAKLKQEQEDTVRYFEEAGAAASTAASEEPELNYEPSDSDTPSLKAVKEEYAQLLAAKEAHEELLALQEEYDTLKAEYDALPREDEEDEEDEEDGGDDDVEFDDLGALGLLGEELLQTVDDDIEEEALRPRRKKDRGRRAAREHAARASAYMASVSASEASESDPTMSDIEQQLRAYKQARQGAGVVRPQPAARQPAARQPVAWQQTTAQRMPGASRPAASGSGGGFWGYADADVSENVDEDEVDGYIDMLDQQLAEISGVHERVLYLNRMLQNTEARLEEEDEDEDDVLAGVYGDEASVTSNTADEEVARVATGAKYAPSDATDVDDALRVAMVDLQDIELAKKFAESLPVHERKAFFQDFFTYIQSTTMSEPASSVSGLDSVAESHSEAGRGAPVHPIDVSGPSEGRSRPPTRRPGGGLEDPAQFIQGTRPRTARSRGAQGLEEHESFLRSTQPAATFVVQGMRAPFGRGANPVYESEQSSLSGVEAMSDISAPTRPKASGAPSRWEGQREDLDKSTIYEEVGKLIACNEGNTEFLVRVFRELQMMTTSELQARAIYALTQVRRATDGLADDDTSVGPVSVGVKRAGDEEEYEDEIPRQKRRPNTMPPAPSTRRAPRPSDATQSQIQSQLRRLDQINYFIQNMTDESPNKTGSSREGSAQPPARPAPRPTTAPSHLSVDGPQRFANNGNGRGRARAPSNPGVYDYAESISTASTCMSDQYLFGEGSTSESEANAYTRNSKDDPLFDTAVRMKDAVDEMKRAMPEGDRLKHEREAQLEREQAHLRRTERLDQHKKAVMAKRARDEDSLSLASEQTVSSVDSHQMDRLAAEYSEDIVKNEAIITALERMMGAIVQADGTKVKFSAVHLAHVQRTISSLLAVQFPSKAVDRQLSECLKGATMKYKGMFVEVFKEDLLHDIADVLYDEMIFARVLAQVDKSYADEIDARVAQIIAAGYTSVDDIEDDVVDEIEALRHNRADDLATLQKERLARLKSAAGSESAIEADMSRRLQHLVGDAPLTARSDLPQRGSETNIFGMSATSDDGVDLHGDYEDACSSAAGEIPITPDRGADVIPVTRVHESPARRNAARPL